MIGLKTPPDWHLSPEGLEDLLQSNKEPDVIKVLAALENKTLAFLAMQ